MHDSLDPSRPPGTRASFFTLVPLAVWLAMAGVFGGIVGLGGFTFTYAQGASYLSNDPRACVNCHVMRDVYDAWSHGSHKAVAVCNDCHTPHELVAKYAVKAIDGVKHSTAFTLGGYPDTIRIDSFDRPIVYQNCLRCHGDLVAPMSHAGEKDPTDCLRCHRDVGHSH